MSVTVRWSKMAKVKKQPVTEKDKYIEEIVFPDTPTGLFTLPPTRLSLKIIEPKEVTSGTSISGKQT